MALPLMRSAAIVLLLLSSAEKGSAQNFPDPRNRVEIKFDDPARQASARSVRVRDSQCRETISDTRTDAGLRQRLVDLAAREWEAFQFPVLDIASKDLPLVPSAPARKSASGNRPIIPAPLNFNMPDSARMLRNGLLEDDAAVAARIGGYWATVPNTGAIATQNVIWGKGGWPGAGWAQPWSAAFISWVMCEVGLTRNQFIRAPSHAQYIAGFFQGSGAFAPRPMSDIPDIGDMVCASRDKESAMTSLEQAEKAAREDAPMHCDIIVGLMPGRALLIGGNVRNAVTLTIAARDGAGKIVPDTVRPWFGLMKLNAPPDPKAGLARTPWQCLGKKEATFSCLNTL